MTLARHWHGYVWSGGRDDLKESARRPPAPGTADAQVWLRSTIPPLQTGHYLLRRPGAGCTWTNLDDVVNWLVAGYEKNPPFTRPEGAMAYVSLDSQVITARDGLSNGVDAWWQHYLSGMGQIVLAVICCPHSHLKDIPCPMPPDT